VQLAFATVFRRNLKLPQILIPVRFESRLKPLRYTNRRVREVLGWTPPLDFRECLRRTFEPEVPARRPERTPAALRHLGGRVASDPTRRASALYAGPAGALSVSGRDGRARASGAPRPSRWRVHATSAIGEPSSSSCSARPRFPPAPASAR
jgi:hypothetical protein